MLSPHHAEGQSLIESCIVIGLICLLLAGLFQLAQLFVAREIIDYAAGRGARARTVGLNDFMVNKTVRVGAIVNAGALVVPERLGNGPWDQWTSCELPRIPQYMLCNDWQENDTLDYTLWNTITWSCPAPQATPVHCEVRQDVPLVFFPNLFRAFYTEATVPMQGVVEIENHYSLYLQ